MKKLIKFIKTIAKIGLVAYILLFIVYYFDLDGKAIFYGVEPLMCKIYEKRERRDPLKKIYGMDKPNYEYNVK